MKIQLLNSSKLKIYFNKLDLDENNITLHSFLSGSINSQKFIQAVLEIAYEDFGFKIDNKINNFIYEIYCFDFSEFIIIVSKNKNSSQVSYTSSQRLSINNINTLKDTHTSNHFSFKFCNNTLLNSKNLYFFFNKFDEFLSFSEYIKNNINFKNINSSLYTYDSIFLLEITTSELLISELKTFLAVLLEYKTNSLASKATLIRFKEFAQIISSKNALNL